MSCTSLHHIEMCLGTSSQAFSLFTSGLGFRVVAVRDTPTCSQKVLKQENTVLVVTQRSSGQPNGAHLTHLERQPALEEEHFTVFCCRNNSRHTTDSVFNAAVVVKNVHAVTERAERMGGEVIRKPTVVTDEFGQITYSIIATGFGNSVHTLIDKTKYRGKFLPGFVECEPQVSELTVGPNEHSLVPLTTHVDHVAYVCEEGQSSSFINWYEQVFSMRRFLVNREEDIENGLEIGDTVGLRLRALEYWRCSETGLYAPEQGADTSLKIVVAEPITSIRPNHVSEFLVHHKGPGLQHIAFHAPLLLHTVAFLGRRSVPFRKPPPEYYSHGGKRAELEQVGLGKDADLLQAAGVLLDTEADPQGADYKDSKDRYLLQIFSEPIFGPSTFFLEFVHRAGAQGFGVGNITALARSIILHQRQQQQQYHQQQK